MNRKHLFWVALSIVLAFVSVLASCAPAAVQQTAAPTKVDGTVVQSIAPAVIGEPVKPVIEVKPTASSPQYGGIVTVIESKIPKLFDDAFGSSSDSWSLALTNECLTEGDWAKGPAGTGEVSWSYPGGFEGIENYCHGTSGGVVEAWEIDVKTNSFVFHIRQNIYWALNPGSDASKLVNGRLLTTDDIIFSINRQLTTPISFINQSFPKPTSVTASDKTTVVFKYASFSDMTKCITSTTEKFHIYPREVATKYGDMRDWRNSVGTGPYMLTDYVTSSSLTLIRNPNYWAKDPVGSGKGNQLPYADGVRILVIPDVSTQLAAMRTAKGDQSVFTWDMAATLRKTNPELLWKKSINNDAYGISLRVDDPSFPWTKKNVRQAMRIAVDFKAIVDTYYGGDADMYSYPTVPAPEYTDLRVPIDKMPQAVQDLWKYQPDKAKQMLTDAGYANGFDIEVVCRMVDVDILSIYKNYLSKVGVNLVLAPKELAVYTSVYNARTHKNAMFASMLTQFPLQLNQVRDPVFSNRNLGFVKDSHVDDVYNSIFDNYMDWPKRCQMYKDLTPYIIDNSWIIPAPASYNYIFWQPWINNYHGEVCAGNGIDPNWVKFVWVDQNLKEKNKKTK